MGPVGPSEHTPAGASTNDGRAAAEPHGIILALGGELILLKSMPGGAAAHPGAGMSAAGDNDPLGGRPLSSHTAKRRLPESYRPTARFRLWNTGSGKSLGSCRVLCRTDLALGQAVAISLPSRLCLWLMDRIWSVLLEKLAPRAERNCELRAADPLRNYATAHFQDSQARPRACRAHPISRWSEADIEGTRRPARS